MDQIAIVGMSCLFPGAAGLAEYWANITNGVDAISDVPASRWDASFYDPDSRAIDRFYCRRGGFVDDLAAFDPVAFGVMPKAADAAEPDQLLMLKIGFEALRDAGYQERAFARERTGVVIGRGNYITAGGARLGQHVRVIPQVLLTLAELFPDMGPAAMAQVKERLLGQLDYFGPDVAAGMIPNLVASRLANKLDLRGPAFTVDAACASSLIALEHACTALHGRQADMMMVGGVHLCHDLTFWATFCQLGALSRSGVIRPFSQQADGILAGEGVGMVVLKRLEDAVASGDRIYAVIEGVGSASDGRSGSLIAPSADGQFLALKRAWEGLPFDPQAIGLLEAHGTGTPAGDEAELETVARFFGPPGASGGEAIIGSVKSMIGHTMPAAGIAGLIKGALAVYHGVLPPSLHCGEPHSRLRQTRFRILDRAQAWDANRADRIAGVNAFGFGGINAHVVLRGHPPLPGHKRATTPASPMPRVVTLSAATVTDLLERLDAGLLDVKPEHGACRLAIVDPDNRKLELARKVVVAGQPWHGRSDIYFTTEGLVQMGGKVAVLFPGIDSSFAPQLDGLAEAFEQQVPLHLGVSNASNALLGTALGVLEFNRYMSGILQLLGIRPGAFAGHSIGEWSAMHAAGVMTAAGLEERIGASLANNQVEFPDVLFLAAGCDAARMREAMQGLDGVAISHENCPHQAIACGYRDRIEILASRLRDAAVFAEVLPFVSGFHSNLFRDHLGMYREFFDSVGLGAPQVPVWSATTAAPYPTEHSAIRTLAIDHLLMPVRFHAMVDALYASGCRIFIQAGTGSLVGFVNDILKGRPHLALPANQAKRSALAQLTHLSAALWVEGLAFDTRLLASPGPERAGESPPANATAQRQQGRLLALGVPMVRVGQPLDVGLVPGTGTAGRLAAQTADPVQKMVYQTIAEIERATRDVASLFARHGVDGGRITTEEGPAVPMLPAASQDAPAPVSGQPRVDKRIHRTLDLATTIPYVGDHALHPQREGWTVVADRYPVVPMTMEVMLVREAVEETLAGYKVLEVRDIQAYKWLSVAERCEVDIVVQTLGPDLLTVEIEGYFRARVVVAQAYGPPVFAVDDPLVDCRETAIEAYALYRDNWMFHGPAYQGIARFRGIGSNGIDGDIRVPNGKGALLDNMGQLAGYWVMEQPINCLAMPIGVGVIRFHGPDPAPGQQVTNRVRVRKLDSETCLTDHVLLDAAGNVCITIEGWATRRYRMDRTMWANSRRLDTSMFSRPLADGVVLFEDVHDTAIMRDHLACRYLSQPEMAVYEQLPPRRKRQWLSGRVAAKDAVRAFMWEVGGIARVFPKEMRIENLSSGAPRVVPHVTETVPVQTHLSISHKAGIAVAMASDTAVGVDVETIEPRPDSFVAMVCSETEWRLFRQDDRDVAVTKAWVAKESVAKSLEIGLGANLRQLIVEAVEGNRIRVSGHWVRTAQVGPHIVGWTQQNNTARRLQAGAAQQEKQGN